MRPMRPLAGQPVLSGHQYPQRVKAAAAGRREVAGQRAQRFGLAARGHDEAVLKSEATAAQLGGRVALGRCGGLTDHIALRAGLDQALQLAR